MEVGGGEILDETALLLLQEQAEFVSLRAPAVLILALAGWGLVLYVFRWLHIDITCIYPIKLGELEWWWWWKWFVEFTPPTYYYYYYYYYYNYYYFYYH